MFENYIRNARTDRYKLVCYIYANEKHNPSIFDDGSSGGGNELTSNATTEALVSLSATFDLIDCWLKFFDHNYIEQSNIHSKTMKGLFEKISVELPKPQSQKEKRYSLLNDIGGEWYTKKNEKIPFLNKLNLRKK